MTDHPTAPVQDDEWLRTFKAFVDELSNHEAVTVQRDSVMHSVFRCAASRLSPTPETGLVEALTKIDQWATAYPVKVFPEPDLDKVVALLTEAGMREQMDRMHASWARHLLEGVGEIASDALSNVLPDEV